MRAIVLVIDGLGVGALPDSKKYNDLGTNTLRHIREVYDLKLPNLAELGLFNIDSSNGDFTPEGAYGKVAELSKGKDTTVGHWEIAGLITKEAMPTFPKGFPNEFVEQLEKACGVEFLCNAPYSGTEVIKNFGQEHLRTGKPILYTSADSVLQIATHVDKYSIQQLHDMCQKARDLCVGKYAVGRVIARPFEGQWPFSRRVERKDFSVDPHGTTLLDTIKENGMEVVAVGKIESIFNGKGITQSYHTKDNLDGLQQTLSIIKQKFDGLVFVNLVDTDMKYGHRRDVIGYAQALEDIDAYVAKIKKVLKKDDVLYITADHGCDPTHQIHTDHTREYTPLLIYGMDVLPTHLGIVSGMDSIAETIKAQLGLSYNQKSLWEKIEANN